MIQTRKVTAAKEAPVKSQMLDLAAIRLDDGTQSRAGLNDDTTAEYAEAISAGAQFPAVTVFFDGEVYWLGDGFHRAAAHQQAGKKKISADVRQGARRDAILHSVGANSLHGLRRTREDKHRAVQTLLDDPEWSVQGIRWIARTAGVSEGFAHKLFHERTGVHNEQIGADPSQPHLVSKQDRSTVREVTRGGMTYTMQTASIGKAGGAQTEQITSETRAPQGVEGGAQAGNTAEEITSSAPVDDPFDVSSEPVATDPVADPALSDDGVQQSSGEVASSAASSVSGGAGNQALRILVHTKVRGFDTFCKEHPPEYVAEGVRPDEVASMRYLVGRVNKWLDAFLDAAKKGGKQA